MLQKAVLRKVELKKAVLRKVELNNVVLKMRTTSHCLGYLILIFVNEARVCRLNCR